MNKLLSLALVTLLAGTSTLVEAAPRDGGWRDGHARHGQHDRGHHNGGRHGQRDHGHRNYNRHGYRGDDRRWNDRRHDDRRYSRHDGHHGHRPPVHVPHYGHRHGHRHAYNVPRYVRPHGYRPYRWSSGHYLPSAYYGPSYYVDYRPYRLAPPPYGHRWVRIDGDVFLVAVATGLIADAVYGIFH